MKEREVLREKTDDLIEVLYNFLHEHDELVKLLEEKKKAIIELRPDAIESLNRAEEERIQRIGLVDGERIALVTEIGEHIGHPQPPRLRIRELVRYVEDDQVDTLLDLRDRIRDTGDRMGRLNDLNRSLVVHSVEHIYLFISMLTGSDPDSKPYTASGTKEDNSLSLLDRRG